MLRAMSLKLVLDTKTEESKKRAQIEADRLKVHEEDSRELETEQLHSQTQIDIEQEDNHHAS